MLTDLRDPSKYVRVPGVNVFDEHEDKDKNGKVVRRFTKAKLEALAKINNRRSRAGDLSTLVYGHTDPDDPDETKQPAPRGYAMNYRVEYDRLHGRWMLRADYFFRRRDYKDAVSYPHSSIELWPDDGTIFPIALLRRAPQRDLGAWTYARGDDGASLAPLGVSRLRYSRPGGRLVIRYSMPFQGANHMADDLFTEDPGMGGDVPPAEGGDMPTPEEHAEYARHCAKHYAKIAGHPLHQKMQQYAMEDEGMDEPMPEDLPPGDPTDMPGDEPMPEEPEMHSAGAFAAPSATNAGFPGKGGTQQYRKGGDPLLYRRIEELERREATKAAENWALALEHEGYELDEDPEDGDIVNLARHYRKGGDAACEKYAGKIRKLRKHAITHQGRVPLADTQPVRHQKAADLEGDPESMPVADQEKVYQYKRDNNLWDISFAEAAAKAMPQKYGRHANRAANGTSKRGG